jgi:mannosylglucosylglycerate synthase
MRIGIIIGRIGGIDGVALETEKWIDVFKRMGHEIFIIAGQFEERKMNPETETLVPEMSFFSPESYWGQKKAFFYPEADPDELIEHIEFYSDIIAEKILAWISEKKIDIVISENASALPAHLEMGWGVEKAIKKSGIPTITHDHDFAWERGDRYVSPHKQINKLVKDVFPLILPNVVHAVINTNAKNTLNKMFGVDSVNVPNVMDFDMDFGEKSKQNSSLRRDLGVKENDVLLFQVTRVVRRKGIEVAIELLEKLNDKNIKLIITGSWSDDAGSAYYNELIDLVHKLKLLPQVKFAANIINNTGLMGSDNQVNYSLSDAYAHAIATTYFSTYEGFGNAFVESVLAKTPIFVNNYEPVYWPDIGSKGFKAVMLENNVLTETAIKEMAEVIYNEKLNKEIAEHNFQLGKKYFSYDTLEEKLTELIDRVKKV